ncbi:MAG: baseplate J/gp47 family protein, partial [Candidatus Gastranaerophilales bacterium]|nr:baseplate J/gp47 family protein [Candidatus Gastranaerophilales bacterium]
TSPSAGVVNIYPLTSDGNPSDEIIQIVQEYLSDDKIRPLTDNVVVLSPERIDFEIAATITLYLDSDEESVLTTITSKIEEYKSTLSSALGKDVIQTQIITIINSVYGVFKVELESPVDIEILKYQWANLENYSITVGGYADE